MERITDVLQRHAAERPGGLAAADGVRRLDWAGLAAAVDARAEALRRAGIATGDRVALIAPDGIDALVDALAVLAAGGVHTPLDHRLATAEVDAAVVDLDLRWRIDRAGEPPVATGVAPVADPLGPGRSAFLRCSSGTTGAAKGVLLSHATIRARCAAANRLLALGPDDRVLWLLPMAWHFAVSIGLYLQVGAAVVFGAALRASRSAAIARDHGCTFAYVSPWHVRRLAALPPGEDLPSDLRQVVATTAALDRDSAAAFRARHGLGVRQALGIIEVGLPLCGPDAEDPAPGALGRPGPDYAVRVVDATGAALPTDATGELELRGPGLVDAYTRPWTPRDAILRDGWFNTGDLARIDASGAVTLLGRRKELINVGGVKVFPLEVEAVLAAHPDIAACRVRGEADPRTGEAVVAEIEPAAGADLDDADLARWCAERLAPLKCPARFRQLALARTPSGKVRRD